MLRLSGKVVRWDGEFTNPGALHRRGWGKDMFKPGEQYDDRESRQERVARHARGKISNVRRQDDHRAWLRTTEILEAQPQSSAGAGAIRVE